jgi:PAS domain S-box-containing protein
MSDKAEGERGAPSPSSLVLRARAERRLAERSREDAVARLLEEARALTHEFEVHRVELELQNEELQRSQLLLAESEDRYRSLHDFAPVGYLTLDAKDIVLEANWAAAEQLRQSRGALIGQPFAQFVAKDHQERWARERQAALAKPGAARFELELELWRGDATPLDADVVASCSMTSPENEIELRIALVDATQRRRNIRELERAQQALRESAAQAALAEQRERRSLAADLHDDVGQLLSIAALRLHDLSTARGRQRDLLHRELGSLLSQARQRVSSLSFQLSPPVLYDVGLRAAAQWLAEDLQRLYGLVVQLEDGTEIEDLDEATRVTLFRGLRELLLNTVRHARTQRASVTLRADRNQLCLEVSDAGVGFDPQAPSSGFGLPNLRGRIEHLGGRMEIHASRERGTRVVIRVPYRQAGA